MIFGNWRPAGLLAGSALFGYLDELQLRAGALLVLAIASQRPRPPEALGAEYRRGEGG